MLTDFDEPVVSQQEITGLHVPVDDEVFVEEFEAPANIKTEAGNLRLRQWFVEVDHDGVDGTTTAILQKHLFWEFVFAWIHDHNNCVIYLY